MKTNFIAVVDCNNFFVSCERVFRPDLEGKPVIVLSSNDGCVVARSQEVKDMVIPMGVPVFQIKDIIKDKKITLFSSNFTLYRDFSRRVFAIVKANIANFEQYSIDEAFISLDSVDENEAKNIASNLKQKIFMNTGIPVSIGIGHTKTQAKYASTRAKREVSGVFVTNQLWWDKNAEKVAIGDIWGVGRQLRERYQKNNILTVEDLLKAPSLSLQTIGGVVSKRLQLELAGVMVNKIALTKKVPKSIMSSRSFGVSVTEKSVLLSAITHHLHSVVNELEEQKLLAGQVSVYIEEKTPEVGRKNKTFSLSLEVPTRNITVLLSKLYILVDCNYSRTTYKKAGVMVSGLTPENFLQQKLFTDSSPSRLAESNNEVSIAQSLMYELQKKFNNKAMTIGTNTSQMQWKSRQELCSPNYTTDWMGICSVKAQ